MANSVTLGTISKRVNSTSSTFTTVESASNFHLKNGTSVQNPILVINTSKPFSDFMKCNYMSFNNSYYWITDIKSLRDNLIEVSATRDVLATFKSAIGNYNAYITRCNNSSYYDKREFDNIVKPTTRVRNHTQQNLVTGFSTTNTTTVISPNGVRAQFFATRFSPQGVVNHALDTSDVLDMIENNFGRCNEYFNLSKVYPFQWASLSNYPDDTCFVGTKETVMKGGLEIDLSDFTGTTGTTGTPSKCTRKFTNTITLLPSSLVVSGDNGTYTDYRHYSSNFTQVVANCPFVGMVGIDPIYLNSNQINFVYNVDIITGVGQLSVYADYGSSLYQIGTFDFQCGFDVPITNYQTNYVQIGVDVVNQDATGLINDMFNPPTLKSNLSKASGFASHVIGTLRVDLIEYESESFELTNIKGFTTNKRADISNVAGYIECMNPSLSVSGATKSEIEQINSFLQGGFYYE